MELGETLEQAIAREVREETGLDVHVAPKSLKMLDPVVWRGTAAWNITSCWWTWFAAGEAASWRHGR